MPQAVIRRSARRHPPPGDRGARRIRADRRLLLVLDACERLVAECARLVEVTQPVRRAARAGDEPPVALACLASTPFSTADGAAGDDRRRARTTTSLCGCCRARLRRRARLHGGHLQHRDRLRAVPPPDGIPLAMSSPRPGCARLPGRCSRCSPTGSACSGASRTAPRLPRCGRRSDGATSCASRASSCCKFCVDLRGRLRHKGPGRSAPGRAARGADHGPARRAGDRSCSTADPTTVRVPAHRRCASTAGGSRSWARSTDPPGTATTSSTSPSE